MRRKILFFVLCLVVLSTASTLAVHSLEAQAQTSSPVTYLSSGTQNRYVVYESFMRLG